MLDYDALELVNVMQDKTTNFRPSLSDISPMDTNKLFTDPGAESDDSGIQSFSDVNLFRHFEDADDVIGGSDVQQNVLDSDVLGLGLGGVGRGSNSHYDDVCLTTAHAQVAFRDVNESVSKDSDEDFEDSKSDEEDEDDDSDEDDDDDSSSSDDDDSSSSSSDEEDMDDEDDEGGNLIIYINIIYRLSQKECPTFARPRTFSQNYVFLCQILICTLLTQSCYISNLYLIPSNKKVDFQNYKNII